MLDTKSIMPRIRPDENTRWLYEAIGSICFLGFFAEQYQCDTTLRGDKVSILTYTVPHEPIKIK